MRHTHCYFIHMLRHTVQLLLAAPSAADAPTAGLPQLPHIQCNKQGRAL